MRLTRARFTVRRLMVAVAVAACLMAFATRPHPRMILGLGAVMIIQWSDDTSTVASGDEPAPKRMHEYGPVMRVDWSDGSTSWYYVGLLPWLRRLVKTL